MQITILTSNDIDLMMPASTVEHHIHDALQPVYPREETDNEGLW